MADIKRTQLGLDMDAWIHFAQSMNCELLTVDDEDFICISDVFRFKFVGDGNLRQMQLYVNDEPTTVSTELNISGAIVTCVCSPDFVWFTILDNEGYYDHARASWRFFYELVGGMHLYKWDTQVRGNVTTSFGTLGPIIDKETGYQYTHNARLNFNTEPGTILYTSDVLFQNDTKIVIDTNFLACTEITEDQVVVFNMHEYYSMSNHILVAMWNEEEEEGS